MPRKLVIGRSGNQPFPIVDLQVSNYHADLIIGDDYRLQIIDTESTNGTYIYNGREFLRIKEKTRYPVKKSTIIRLGPITQFHVSRLVPGLPDPPDDKGPVDISHLRKISDSYMEKKLELQAKLGNINSLRSLTFVVSIVAGGGGKALADVLGFGRRNEALTWVLSIALALVLIFVLLTLINRMNHKLLREQSENEKRYAMKYSCPKCGHSFKGLIYENILAGRRCPRCGTEFFELSSDSF